MQLVGRELARGLRFPEGPVWLPDGSLLIRSPLFDQARDLLSEAGWGLDELFEAIEEGPARSALFEALGLQT